VPVQHHARPARPAGQSVGRAARAGVQLAPAQATAARLPQLSRYLKSAFPKAALTLRNGAIPATGSAYAYRCFDKVVDTEVRPRVAAGSARAAAPPASAWQLPRSVVLLLWAALLLASPPCPALAPTCLPPPIPGGFVARGNADKRRLRR
jgi:hypothetical protein